MNHDFDTPIDPQLRKAVAEQLGSEVEQQIHADALRMSGDNSMSVPTPGPWRIDTLSSSQGMHIVGANGDTIVVESDYFEFPDEMGSGQREQIAATSIANAHLIAAAWELLEVGTNILHWLDHIDQATFDMPTLREYLRSAIRKAKG